MIMMMMMIMIIIIIILLHSATSNYALSALHLLKHELMYRLFFTHTNIHPAAIVGASTISFTPTTHSLVTEISILNLLNALAGIRTRVSRVW